MVVYWCVRPYARRHGRACPVGTFRDDRGLGLKGLRAWGLETFN